jgi:plastocyanin
MMSLMFRRLRLRALAPLLVLGLGAAACSGGNNVPVNSSGFGTDASYTATPAAVVILKYSSFEPATLTVRSGDTVQWSWQDSGISHNVRILTPTGQVLAQSPTMKSGTWEYTFNSLGTYPYLSTIDARMVGTIVVNG